MNFGQAIGSGFKNYVGFESRACRSEFWFWFLFVLLGSIATLIIDFVLFPGITIRPFNTLYGLALFLPGWMVSIRRLHDIDRSGWWVLLGFVPLIGVIILIVWFVRRGDESNNRFGADPLAVAAA